MKVFFDNRQLLHAPVRELHNGNWTDYAEVTARAESILRTLGQVEAPFDYGEAPITAVHTHDYIEFLKTAVLRWRAAGRNGDAIGYVWPVVRRRSLKFDRIDADLGRYSMDASTPLTDDTWTSAYWNVQAAIGATAAVLSGDRSAFALCRPPGHHAGADYLGGYCYLNNIAVAAQYAIDAGRKRVAILDIDYHHGNGTQDIFWHRGDVLFASLHADPVMDFPFFWGHADERGEGDGEGATINIPLPRGTAVNAYRNALSNALSAISAFGPDILLVSFGADTFSGDPISYFELKTADYKAIAADIAALGYPTVIVMEGGYAIEELGSNTASFLAGF